MEVSERHETSTGDGRGRSEENSDKNQTQGRGISEQNKLRNNVVNLSKRNLTQGRFHYWLRVERFAQFLRNWIDMAINGKGKNYSNLSKEEQQALKTLKNSSDIVIKEEDKGGLFSKIHKRSENVPGSPAISNCGK